jgi:hypothetical protein
MAKPKSSTAITVAASNAGKALTRSDRARRETSDPGDGRGAVAKRFQACEAEASRIHAEQSGASLVRALLDGSGLHAVISDGKSTIEICGGKVALSVTQDRPETA